MKVHTSDEGKIIIVLEENDCAVVWNDSEDEYSIHKMKSEVVNGPTVALAVLFRKLMTEDHYIESLIDEFERVTGAVPIAD